MLEVITYMENSKHKIKLILASNNAHKVRELRTLLPDFDIITPKDLNDQTEVEENSDTLEGNSYLKAKYFFEKYNIMTIADDSGIFCDALDNMPGVYSARYASLGSEKLFNDDHMNNRKLINDLQGKDHSAHFSCVICLIELNGKVSYFEGNTYGHVLDEYDGENGFGYDCIFYSNDLNKCFGRASAEEKDSVSHRGRASKKLKEYLEKYYG